MEHRKFHHIGRALVEYSEKLEEREIMTRRMYLAERRGEVDKFATRARAECQENLERLSLYLFNNFGVDVGTL